MSPVDIETSEVLFNIHSESTDSGKKSNPAQRLERRRQIEEIHEKRSLQAEWADF